MQAIETPAAEKPAVWGIWAGIGFDVAYVALQIVAVVVVTALAALVTGQAVTDASFDGSIATNFIYLLLADVALLGILHRYLGRRRMTLRDLGWTRFRSAYVGQALLASVAYIVLYVTIFAVASQFVPALREDNKQDLGFDNPIGTIEMLLTFVSLVVLPPIVEETLFRGFIYKGARRRFGFIGATFVTSVLFAAGHLFGSETAILWLAALDTFVLSVVMCYLRERSHSLWPSVIMHALKNGLAFSVLYFAQL